MVWLPIKRLEVVKAAVPFDTIWVPRVVVPSRNVTVPVGVPSAGATAETVAVKVTGWPGWDGFAEEVSATDVLPWLTTWVSAVDVALVKFVSPEYAAVTLWLPTSSALVANVATPFDNVPVPSWVAGVVVLSRKVTVPVGVPSAGATAETVAVKVTDSPVSDGLADDVSATDALPWLTTWVSDVDVVLVKFVSPE